MGLAAAVHVDCTKLWQNPDLKKIWFLFLVNAVILNFRKDWIQTKRTRLSFVT